MHEWPLLIFTIALQAAIGCTVMLWIFQMRYKDNEKMDLFELFKIPLIVIAGLALVGLGASFAHLGAPLNAINTIRNISSSWMSREIVVTGTFIGLAVITAAWAYYSKKITPWLLLVTGIVGLIDVYCMAALYSNSLIGSWNSIHTFMSFYGTTFILGSILAVAMLAPALYKNEFKSEAKQFVKIGLAVTLLGVAFHVIGLALFPQAMTGVNIIGGTAATEALAGYGGMISWRWIISILGVGLFVYLALSSYKKYFTSLTVLALAVFVLSEGMGRYLFYVLGA